MSHGQPNTPELWDRVWADAPWAAEDVYALAKEEQSVRWRRIERIVLQALGSFQGLRVIEIGAGLGTHAALMARRGARATLLDYSPRALAGRGPSSATTASRPRSCTRTPSPCPTPCTGGSTSPCPSA